MVEIERLLELVRRLRDPVTGDPWALAQNLDSIVEYVEQEVIEVTRSLMEGAPQDIAEELGDLLLQIILISQIANEQGNFQFKHVVEKINQKLVIRVPGLENEIVARDIFEARRLWDAGKVKPRKSMSSK